MSQKRPRARAAIDRITIHAEKPLGFPHPAQGNLAAHSTRSARSISGLTMQSALPGNRYS